jgi:uncharacterized metal-binding protein
MPEPIFKQHRKPSGKRKLLLLLSALSMSLTACARGETRIEFLSPTFQPGELECKAAPRGQLPATATNEQVSERIIGIDEAGEDCRHKLERAKMKVEVFNEVVAEVNAGKKPKK